MPNRTFAELPLIVRLSSLTTFFIAWVLFEELVIDRHGLDHLLPYYRVGNLCPYDLAVLALLTIAWFVLHRR